MGIRGLSSYFKKNSHFTRDYYLRDTKVIIDGNNLLHMLYFSIQYKLDWVYGGEQSRFAAATRDYFTTYRNCNIQPIIIFDGADDISDRKISTLLNRHKDRVQGTRDIVLYNICDKKTMPICMSQIFKDILLELGITIAQCDFECDDQLPSVANHYKCPVLSQDSDFYLFDLPYGFIHLQSIENGDVKHVDSYGHTGRALKCKIYHLDYFLSFFPGVHKSALALFATLMGNDYVDAKSFADNKEYEDCTIQMKNSAVECDRDRRHRAERRERYDRVNGILSYLRHKSFPTAMKQILSYVKEDEKEKIKEGIQHTVDSYTINNCNLIGISNKNDAVDSTQMTTKLLTPCGRPLPAWFLHKFHSCEFPSYFYNIISLRRLFLRSQVEDDDDVDSTYVCSRYIRQILYGILLQRKDGSLERCTKELCAGRCVEEYGRDCEWEKVDPVFEIGNGTVLPMLEETKDLDQKRSREIFQKALGEKSDCFSTVPSFWALLVASIRYWLRNCSPKPSEDFVHALIVNILYFTM